MDGIEKVKNNLFDMTLDAIQEYKETGKEEAADALFALLEMVEKLRWLPELKKKAKESGLHVRFC